MKIIISTLIVLAGFSASADVGDKYSAYGKSNRVSFTNGLIELTAVTVLADTDENPATASVAVKAAVDLNALMMSDYGDYIMFLLGSARDFKFTAGIVYELAGVVKTDKCLGKDFIYTDAQDNWGNGKTCYVVTAKDIIIK
jgi:hypothetical protein